MYGTFTLTGRHATPSGVAHRGQVVVTPNTIIRDTEGNIVLSGGETVTLDVTGAWSIVLPCDSAGLNPAEGIGYKIGYALHSTSMPQQSFYATADLAGTTLDVSDIVSVSVPTPLSAIVGPAGADGAPGTPGTPGADGAAGPKGDPGDSFLTLDADGTPYTGATPTASTRLATERVVGQRVSALTPLKAALAAADRSCAVQVLGDSTGNDTFEWVYTFAQSVATQYPAWSVHYRLWSDTVQAYGAPTVIQTGPGGDRYMDCQAATIARTIPAAASPYISGVIDVRVKLSLADWTPAATTVLVGKSGVDPQRGWYAGITNSGAGARPFFTYTPDGLGSTLAQMTVLTAPTVTDGSTIWMRWVFTPNDGSGNRTLSAYQSADGVTWTQIGATVTTVGAVSVFNNSSTGYSIGGGLGSTTPTGARIYEVEIRDGLNGPNVVPALPDLWQRQTAASAPIVGAPILTFVNGSHPGAAISYLGDATRLPKLTPDFGQAATFLSDSHNEGSTSGPPFVSTYDTWRTNVEAQVPGSPVVVLTQNPETSGASWAAEHGKRRLDLLGYARQKRLDSIDTYQAFLNAGWPGALMADTIHPNAAGQQVWLSAISRAFDAS